MKKTFLILFVLLSVAMVGIASVSAASDDAVSDGTLQSPMDDNGIEEVISEQTDDSISTATDSDNSDDKSLGANPLKDGGPTIYVKTDGDDSKDGLSEENAVATIAQAYNLSSDGSTINIGAGTYDQSSSITLEKSVTFNGAEGTVINRAGSASVFSNTENYILTLNNIKFISNATTSTNPIVNMGGTGTLNMEKCSFADMVAYGSTRANNGIVKIFYKSNANINNCEFYNLAGGNRVNLMYLSLTTNGTVNINNSYFHDINVAENLRAVIYINSNDTIVNVENSIFSNITGPMYSIIDNPLGTLNVKNSTFMDNIINGTNARSIISCVGTKQAVSTIIESSSFFNNDVPYQIETSVSSAEIKNCAFGVQEGKYAIGTGSGTVTANYNFYGIADNPSALLDNVTTSNWVQMFATASEDSVAVGDEITITADFSQYTDGTQPGQVPGTMAEVPVKFINDDTKGAIGDIVYENNKAIVTYTGVAEGEDSVAVTAGSCSNTIPITVTGAAPSGNIIYVKEDGNDGNDGSSPANAVATIARAIQIVNATEGSDFTIFVSAGEYDSSTIYSVEAKNVNLIGEDRDSVIFHFAGTYCIDVNTDNVNWTIENLTISDFVTTSTNGGASLAYLGDGGNFNVNNCVIRNSTSKYGAFYISSTGTVNISNTLLENIYGSTTSGAASITLLGSGTYNFDNITMTGCDLDAATAGESTGYNLRALIYQNNAAPTTTIANSKIINNNPVALSLIESIGVMNIINTTIENNTVRASTSGYNGGQYIIEARNDGNITITQSSIVNNTIAKTGKGIFYTYASSSSVIKGIITVEYSAIFNNVYSDGTAATIRNGDGAFTLDYNYWGSNEKPNVNVANWVIITGEAPEYAFVGVTDEIKVYLNTYNTTSGTTGSLEKAIGEVTLGVSYVLNSENPSTVTIKDGVGTIAYTATESGDETVTLSSGDAFSFEVNADISTLIYVDGSVETSGTGTAESPFKTIAEALAASDDGKIIIILSGTYPEKNLNVQKDITIKADKGATVIIDAGNEDRIFTIMSTAILKDLTLINGHTEGTGAGIFDMGNLTLNNVKIFNCTATMGGAAVYVYNDANLTVLSSEFIDNKGANGGAIYVEGNANITNSKFITNDPDNGGAIYVTGSANIEGNEFTSNNATNGGAIYIDSNKAQTITGNTFTSNTADKGEAIYIKNAAVTLSGNTMDGETIYLESGSVNAVLIFLGNNTVTADFGQTITLTATLTDDQGNSIRGGSVTFTANGVAIGEPVDLSGSSPLEISYTVPTDADDDIVISGSYSGGGVVATGAIHPAIPYWFIGANGYETLADAVAAAQNGDVIIGKPGTYTVNGITVNKDITIKANETGTVILDGNKTRMFTIGSLTTFTLLNLDLCNGGTGGAGFVSVGSTGILNVINSTLRDLSASSAGGAITVTNGGKVNIEGSRFENINSTSGPAVLQASGASSVITIKDSSFDKIIQKTNDHTFMQVNGNLTVERSNFTNIEGKPSNNYYTGISTYSSGANFTITECQFINMTGGDGAAIYFGSTGNINVTKSVFMNISSVRGAIFLNNFASANVNYNLFIDNVANPSSNAKDVYINSGNNVDASYNYWGNNSQPTDSQIKKPEKAPYWTIVELSAGGDTVYLGTNPTVDVKFVATNGVETVALEDVMPQYSFDLSATSGTIAPTAVTIVENAASATYTPEAQGAVNITATPGPAVLELNVVDPSILLVVSTLGSNDGLGTFDSPYATIAYALSQVTETRNIIYLVKTENDYKEHGLTVSGNVTIKAEDETVTIDGEKSGRIFVVTGTLALEGLRLTGGMVTGSGGAIYLNGGNLSLSNVNISNSIASADGGAIYANAASNLNVTGSVFEGNNATNGGAIYALGKADICETKFIGGTATDGGALYVAGEANVSLNEFTDNNASYGGAIYVAGIANVSGNDFNGNNATNGGAIYINTTSPATVSTNRLGSNKADKGDAVYIENGQVNLTGNTISDIETIYLAGGSVNSVLIFLGTGTINAEFGETVTLTATLTDDQANPIRGGTVTFTANGETIGPVDLSGDSPLEISYTVPMDATGDIVISGSYSLDNGGVVASGTVHPIVPKWFIEGKGGYETLSQAIDDASAGDVIYYDKEADYSEIINGKTVNKNLVIKNNGTGVVTLDAGASKVFTLSADLELNNLNFINGQGFISQSSGTLNIINSTFKDSRYSNHGVVVSATGSSNINIVDSVFENLTSNKGPIDHEGTTGLVNIKNSVFNNITGGYDGFVIYCKSALNIENSNFTNLFSTKNSSGSYFGAICCEGSGDLKITGSYFNNVIGPKGAVIYYAASGTCNISKNIFESSDSKISGSDASIIFSSTSGNINYNVFLDITKGIKSSYANIDYNYWGTNDYASAGISGTSPNNWVIMIVSPDIAVIEIDDTQAFTVDFKHYTDGTANYTLADTIPELVVSASALNGAISPSEIETVGNEAQFTYTATTAGEDTVTFTNANAAVPVTFDVSTSPVGVIYVAKNGTATGTGLEDDPVDTIARAIELANEAKGKIIINEGVYTETGFNITKDLSITGLGNVVIDANNVTAKMFNLSSEVNKFVLKNIAITKANQGFGAVLFNNYGANVLFDNVSINESYANGYGEAAIIINKGNLTIMNSNISNNGETTCLIFNNGGNVSINNTLFENNAFNTSGTTFGIVFSKGNCTVAVENSNFTNIASIRGAIHCGEATGQDAKLIIANSNFENCSALLDGTQFGYGGAVHAEVPLTVMNSTFINSKSYKDGAAIYATKGATITDSLFKGGMSQDGDTAEIYSTGDLSISNSVLIKTASTNKYLVKATSGVTVDANGNYWGTNNASSVISGFALDNWVIMTVSSNATEVVLGEDVEISVDFKHTNNTAGEIADFTGILPEITVCASSDNGTLSPAEVTTEGLEAKIIFTPEFGGENKVLIYTGLAKDSIPVIVDVTVPKKATDLAVDEEVSIFVGSGSLNVTLTADGNPVEGKTINVVLNNSIRLNGTTNAQGIASIDLSSFGIGSYNADISFDEDEEYLASEASCSIIINENPKTVTNITVDNEISLTVGSASFNVTLTAEGSPVAGKYINVHLNEFYFVGYTNAQGIAVIDIHSIPVDTYNAEIRFEGDTQYAGSSATSTIVINPISTSLEVDEEISVVVGSGSFNVSLTAGDNPVPNKYINVKLNDSIDLTGHTNALGIAVIDLANVPVGNYNAVIIFEGDTQYNASSAASAITVKSLDTTLSADEEMTVIVGSGSINIVLTADGNPVEGKTIKAQLTDIINLEGTTDASGLAVIDISHVPVGIYDAILKFAGDGTYNPSSTGIKITVKEAPKTAEDLQKLIDDTPEGGVLNLSNTEFANVSGINITKDIKIVGDNTTIATAGDGNPVFNVASNVSSASISGVDFVANNGDVLVKASAANGTDDLSIVNPAIELTKNTVSKANDNVVASSITLFELEAERAVLAPSNEISIKDNDLPEGAKAFDFEIAGINNESSINIPKGGNINTNGSSGNGSASVEKVATAISSSNMKTTTVNTAINGKKAGKNFSITLKDANGNVLADKEVVISFNGKIYKVKTDAKGLATVKVALSKKGTYPVVITFLGDEKYNGTFAVAKITVNPQKVKLTVAKKKYKVKSKKKYLIATLKASNKKAIKGKKIVFIINKKKYTAKTNKKGIAKVKVKLSKKGTYKFTVKFAGDNTFKKISKKGKVTIK